MSYNNNNNNPPGGMYQQQQQQYPTAPPATATTATTAAAAPPTQQARQQQQHQQQQQRNSTVMRPPFVDPQTNVVYDTANAEYEGWLTKQSVWVKEWRRRYFILKGSKLFFAKNEYAAPHGMMDLATCTTVKSADLKSKKRHSFEISTPETQHLLYADTESEKDDWIGRVGKAIVRCSRTYYSNNTPGNNNHNNNNSNNNGAGINEPYQPDDDDDDDIYTNDDPDNPYFND